MATSGCGVELVLRESEEIFGFWVFTFRCNGIIDKIIGAR